MYATHGVLSPAAMERINRRGVTEVVITNSLPFPEHARKSEKIRVREFVNQSIIIWKVSGPFFGSSFSGSYVAYLRGKIGVANVLGEFL